MIAPQSPENESQRQLALEKYQLLDTLPEESFDHITSVMSYICNAPISLISLLDNDRNFLKSHHGIPFSESPRDISFCGHAINSTEDITIIKDARDDERFYDNPLVNEYKAIFYAGVPLVNPDGYKLGTLCVYDHEPRELDDEQIGALKAMAKQVEQLFEQRYQNLVLQRAQDKLASRYKELEKFAYVVSHDLKSPLANIISLNEFIKDDNQNILSQDSTSYLELLEVSAYSLKNYIDGLLQYYKSDALSQNEKVQIPFATVFDEVKAVTNVHSNFKLQTSTGHLILQVNKPALIQILVNLVVNAIKYHYEKEVALVSIDCVEDEGFYHFTVEDNGKGILEKEYESIFQLFTVIEAADRNGDRGSGIGLATVKELVTKQGGEISVVSEIGKGSIFNFSLKK